MDGTGLRFDGRVAVVTGGARGLGRAYARAFADRGANVVVNDVAADGEPRPADAVVAAIRAAGGTAIASHHDVTDVDAARAIIETAVAEFGGIDIVVNNAGITHVGSFDEPLDVFSTVLATNLMGTVHVTHAAWKHLVAAQYGRVIMTTSAVGLWGAPHSTAYGAAKAAVVGLAASLAEEGAASNVLVNCIAPAAETRLTQARFPKPGSRRWRPELVVPAALYLGHESCTLSGAVIAAFSGLFSLVDVVQGPGHRFDPRQEIDVEDFVEHLEEITSMEGATSFANGHIEALGLPLGVDLLESANGAEAR